MRFLCLLSCAIASAVFALPPVRPVLPPVAHADTETVTNVPFNAYYFVDVVTEHGPAPIYFAGDRDSRLGNPVVVANAFETNRVPLLIGIDYAITSPVPFAISFPVDYMYPEVTTNGVANYNVRWPLNFVFTEDIGASNRVYTVTVEPYDPGRANQSTVIFRLDDESKLS